MDINAQKEQFSRAYVHPENQQQATLDGLIASYAWHGAHHVAHVTELRRRKGW